VAVYQRGLVLIVDYAERWPLQDVLTLLSQHRVAASTRIRILLLARPGSGWCQSLAYQLKFDRHQRYRGSASLPRWPNISWTGRRSAPPPGAASPPFSAYQSRLPRMRDLI